VTEQTQLQEQFVKNLSINYYNISIIGSPLEPLTYNSNNKIDTGTKVSVKLQNRDVFGVVLNETTKPSFKTSDILTISEFYFSSKQLKLAHFISSYYICSLGDALALMVAFNADIKTNNNIMDLNIDITLSKQQQKAFEFLKNENISLLFGDTGSGKTEIYMKFFEEILSQNKRSIFLMPEISLTPQIGQRLKEHFGESIVLWHSKLTPKQKRETLQKIYDGSAKIIAGPRSTLFLPIKDLGLIVVDEEHDDSYKSSSRPRYNARDLAIYMAKINNIPIILGSATPSLSSYVKFPHIRLKGGYVKSSKKYIYEKSVESLTPYIFSELKQTLNKKEQSIVFVPTRANFKYLICGDCGHTYECVFCSIGMSIHQKSRALKCHYCNYTQAIPQVCSQCHSSNLISTRLGTAQAMIEISQEFQDANIEQFDRDTITTNAKLKKALKRFNNKEIDILIGTQMLSKGHDYKDVTLAVILGMDNMLNMSDYRSREKALSILHSRRREKYRCFFR